jgi:hypothetical protein
VVESATRSLQLDLSLRHVTCYCAKLGYDMVTYRATTEVWDLTSVQLQATAYILGQLWQTPAGCCCKIYTTTWGLTAVMLQSQAVLQHLFEHGTGSVSVLCNTKPQQQYTGI